MIKAAAAAAAAAFDSGPGGRQEAVCLIPRTPDSNTEGSAGHFHTLHRTAQKEAS